MKIQERYFGYNYATFSEYYEGKHDYPEHIHHFLEVLCVLEGEIEITVGKKTETARAGDIAVIFPFQPHSQHTPSHCKIWAGLVSPAYVTDLLAWDNFFVPEKNVFTPIPTTFAYVVEKLPESFWIRRQTSLSKVRFRRTKALFFVILEEFFRSVTFTSTPLHTDALSATYMYVSDHFREDLTLKKIAAEIGYTPNYISSCLSAIPGASFRNLLNSARVDHAKTLLISTDRRIVDIALDCGFSSESVFYGIFEKHTGTTPRKYRLSKRNLNPDQVPKKEATP